MSELVSLTLGLRPLSEVPAPPMSGLLARGLLLGLLRESEVPPDAVADGLGGLPYTVSELGGVLRGEPLRPEREVSLRFTALEASVAGALLQAARDGRFAPGSEVRLGDAPLRVERAEVEETDYQRLGGPWLLGERRPPARFALRLLSPSTFLQGGRHLPFPLPGLVFAGLRERWNRYAPVALPREVVTFAEEALVLSGYRLSTRRMVPADAGLLHGAVGVARYAALRPERYYLSLLALLRSFARYAGVGVATELGMGQCEEEPS